MRNWHTYSVADVLRETQSDAHTGLTEKKVEEQRVKWGKNELQEAEQRSLLSMFIDQYKDFMVVVLLVATVISALLGEHIDALTIAAIMLLNGILGVIQEFRAEKSLTALKKMSAPQAKVLREAARRTVEASELVPGDLIFLEAGDRVPADARWLEVYDLQVDESPLTGESLPVRKQIDVLSDAASTVGDRKNMAFMGTMVARGSGRAVVVETGMNSEMGHIATLIQSTKPQETPLQAKLAQLGKILIFISLVLTFIVVMAGVVHGQPVYEMFLAGVSLAVAAIPEGLPAIVTVALALGVQRMIRRKAIVRKLPSVETLGSATVICSDKTGTLTQNRMTVVSHYSLDVNAQKLMEISETCNNAIIDEQNEQGDPTELALLQWNRKNNAEISGIVRVAEIPFDSERKKMSVLVERSDGANRLNELHCKGAPEMILERCTHYWSAGKANILTSTHKQQIISANERMAGEALRVLGLAFRPLSSVPVQNKLSSLEPAEWEQQLVFVGLVGMIDPPREEAQEAIEQCEQAGIRTIMITGDHRTTAEAIATQLGLMKKGRISMTGAELEQLEERELEQALDKVAVFARVAPEHKMRIVKALQNRGHIVAMTGDGVNDAPAIKAADIGIAMGQSGTDVAKEASSLVLSNDNFSTIVAAIEEGRNIYDNIRKFIRYLLASNVGEMMTMMLAMLMGMPLPLVPIQILWVNLVTDGLPAMALGVDQPEEDLMHRAPRQPRENVFARRLGWKIVSRGVAIGVFTLIAFALTYQTTQHLVHAQTVAFATLVMAQLIHVFDCRSSRSIFHRNLFENKYLTVAVVSSVLLLLGVIYIDWLQPVFHTVNLSLRDWTLVLVMAALPTLMFGAGSLFTNRRKNARISVNSPTQQV
jgi:Ca2+-transporting ATPase